METKQNKYYVYVAIKEDEVVYVGKGTGSRYKHLISGKSHVYEANECFFMGINFTTKIIASFDTSEEALSFESKMIKDINPTWNSTRSRDVIREGFLGVHFEPNSKKPWRCRFKYKGKQYSCGSYETEIDAAKAHDLYVKTNNIIRPINFS